MTEPLKVLKLAQVQTDPADHSLGGRFFGLRFAKWVRHQTGSVEPERTTKRPAKRTWPGPDLILGISQAKH